MLRRRTSRLHLSICVSNTFTQSNFNIAHSSVQDVRLINKLTSFFYSVVNLWHNFLSTHGNKSVILPGSYVVPRHQSHCFGNLSPAPWQSRRYFVIRKKTNLCALRYGDGWEGRTCGENVSNTSGLLNLTTHVWIAWCWVQFTSVKTLALANYDNSCPALSKFVPWIPFIFIKVG
jgi:hypothetical protein